MPQIINTMPPALPLNSLLFHFTGKGEDDNVEGYDDQDDESIDQGISKSYVNCPFDAL